jgi:PhzF family phenazine biosynthesis protein
MQYYIVDAFADAIFKGNQAGVCIVDEFPADSLMQNIAMENNLAETAFVVKRGADQYDLRWFTPEVEIDLCGHATLASAFVLALRDKSIKTINFHTKSGILPVHKAGELFEMDFPSRKPKSVELSPLMPAAIGVPVLEAHLSRDMLLLVESEKQVAELRPNLALLSQIPDCFACIVTAKGDKVDFVSRFFAPNAGIPEDPVTGSSHSTLIPFWAERLGKDKMVARQLSKRGGVLHCENAGERVKIAGKACLYLEGSLRV